MARRFVPWPRRGSPSARASSAPRTSGGAGPGTPALSSLPGLLGGGTPEEQRFAQVYAADRVGPMPYPNQAAPDIAEARSRVRALVGELLDGVDEGTGAALDPLIASWTSGWLARIDSQHADHQAVIDRLIGGARQQLAEAEANHERDRRALQIARQDYHEARERLLEPQVETDEDDGPSAAPAAADGPATDFGPSGATHPVYDEDLYVPPADPPTGPLPRPVGSAERAPYTRPAPSEPGDPMSPDRREPPR